MHKETQEIRRPQISAHKYKCNNCSEGHSIKNPAQGLVQTLIDISNSWISTNETSTLASKL